MRTVVLAQRILEIRMYTGSEMEKKEILVCDCIDIGIEEDDVLEFHNPTTRKYKLRDTFIVTI